MDTRASGILLHLTSLPGPYGIGDLGPIAHQWIDILASAQQTWWQILPLGSPGAGYSPYQSLSAFAGNPMLISPDALVEDGLINPSDLPRSPGSDARVNYPCVARLKSRLLTLAWQQFQNGSARRLRSSYERFLAEHSAWLDDFALFMALRQAHGNTDWTTWPRNLVLRRQDVLRSARHDLADTIGQHQFTQFLFFRQLTALHNHARAKGVRLIGDLPIFISADSADVWAQPHLFLLDRHRRPTHVAGVPPDFFSKTGQRWGNVLYDWHAMERDHFAWWVQRVRATLDQVDLIRLDHFRGFAAFWKIPAHLPTAIGGRWTKALGRQLFQTLRDHLGHLPFIAEDLGVITPDVVALREAFDLPGIRVLQFAFSPPDNHHLPHGYERNTIAYTATHDNDTAVGWYASLAKPARDYLERYHPDAHTEPAWALIRLAWSSVARGAIAPLQDVLRLNSRARMNTPGQPTGNWTWRCPPHQWRPDMLDRLSDFTILYDRSPRADS